MIILFDNTRRIPDSNRISRNRFSYYSPSTNHGLFSNRDST